MTKLDWRFASLRAALTSRVADLTKCRAKYWSLGPAFNFLLGLARVVARVAFDPLVTKRLALSRVFDEAEHAAPKALTYSAASISDVGERWTFVYDPERRGRRKVAIRDFVSNCVAPHRQNRTIAELRDYDHLTVCEVISKT